MHQLEGLIDRKTLRILKFFYASPDEFYHLNHVSDNSKVSLATTFRTINSLVSTGWLEVHKISKFKIYRLAKNKDSKELRDLLCGR